MKIQILLLQSIFICGLCTHALSADDTSLESNNTTETTSITDAAHYVTRAVQTVVLNNALILGSATCKGNMIIDGLFTGTLQCNAVSGPAVSDYSQIATYANTSGLQLASSAATGGGGLSNVADLSADNAQLNTITANAGPLITQDVTCNQSIQEETFTASTGSVSAQANTNTLILKQTPPASTNPFTINMPPSPQDGQLFTVINGGTTDIQKVFTNPGVVNVPGAIIFPFTAEYLLSASNPALTFLYYAANNAWYLAGR